jgi:hypothetical protein
MQIYSSGVLNTYREAYLQNCFKFSNYFYSGQNIMQRPFESINDVLLCSHYRMQLSSFVREFGQFQTERILENHT